MVNFFRLFKLFSLQFQFTIANSAITMSYIFSLRSWQSVGSQLAISVGNHTSPQTRINSEFAFTFQNSERKTHENVELAVYPLRGEQHIANWVGQCVPPLGYLPL